MGGSRSRVGVGLRAAVAAAAVAAVAGCERRQTVTGGSPPAPEVRLSPREAAAAEVRRYFDRQVRGGTSPHDPKPFPACRRYEVLGLTVRDAAGGPYEVPMPNAVNGRSTTAAAMAVARVRVEYTGPAGPTVEDVDVFLTLTRPDSEYWSIASIR